MSNNFVGLLLNSFSGIIFKLQKYYITLQNPFQEELERLQQHNILAFLGVYKTSGWCNSFVLVSMANSKVRLCLDLA